MIPGLNTKVNHAGVEYHVQTEDLGRQKPYILTLIFRGGAIIAREKVNYHEALGEDASDDQIKSFMDQQHGRNLRNVMSGQPQDAVSQPGEEPSPRSLTSLTEAVAPPAEKSLDELIAEYLQRRRAMKSR